MQNELILFGIGKQFSENFRYIKMSQNIILELWDNHANDSRIVDGNVVTLPHAGYISANVHIVITCNYYNEIKKQLLEMGYKEERIHNLTWYYQERVLSFYKGTNHEILEDEKNAIDLIKKNGLKTYNIDSCYVNNQSTINFDGGNGLYYVNYNGFRMYFPTNYTDSVCDLYFNKILYEQNPKSPHCYGNYITDEYYDCVIDAGACECFFAMDMIDKSRRIVVIECDEKWTDIYRHDFSDNSKIEVYKKRLSSSDVDGSITLDNILKEYIGLHDKKILIKMDIEGAEEEALDGGRKLLESDNSITVIACAYHHAGSALAIKKQLGMLGFLTSQSDRCMFFSPVNEADTVNASDEWKNNTDENYRLRNGLVVGYKNVKMPTKDSR